MNAGKRIGLATLCAGIALSVWAFVDTDIVVSPQVIMLHNDTTPHLTVHAAIPYLIVDADSIQLAIKDVANSEIDSAFAFADDRGDLVAKFEAAKVKSMLTLGEATFILTGSRTDGTSFRGEDTVSVWTGARGARR